MSKFNFLELLRSVNGNRTLGTRDEVLEERLNSIESKLDNVTNNDAIKTEVTGSIVEETLILNKTLDGSVTYEFDMDNFSSYRIVMFVQSISGVICNVRPLTRAGSSPLSTTSYEQDIIRIENGYVSEGYSSNINSQSDPATIWSDVYTAKRPRQLVRFYFPSSSSSLDVSEIKVIKYKQNASASSIEKSTNIMDFVRKKEIAPQQVFPELESEDSIVYDYPVVIDYLEWSTNHRTMPSIYIDLKTKGRWSNYLTRAVFRDFSSSKGSQTPEDIQQLKTGLWEVLEFDNESPDRFFKFSLRKPLYAPEGVRIYIQNNSNDFSYSGSIIVKGKQL